MIYIYRILSTLACIHFAEHLTIIQVRYQRHLLKFASCAQDYQDYWMNSIFHIAYKLSWNLYRSKFLLGKNISKVLLRFECQFDCKIQTYWNQALGGNHRQNLRDLLPAIKRISPSLFNEMYKMITTFESRFENVLRNTISYPTP